MKPINQAYRLIEQAHADLQKLSDMQQAEELHGQEVPVDLDDQLETLNEVLELLGRHW